MDYDIFTLTECNVKGNRTGTAGLRAGRPTSGGAPGGKSVNMGTGLNVVPGAPRSPIPQPGMGQVRRD
ncbi:protein of unknown function [Candidatus Hydrogenisulfobacillus filiaventi]|uniref:Uncharacterized protein n=1 Tax=Candidatus Hydrogenisulfobacillus filiaventi TaxID=2707344 RepID=A0A6F8ZFX7_9FIRM|nr:protein of unknown function [Candidatus Hydrogenisulfobacillus filiaventi]